MCLILMGKGASGKDTVLNELVKNHSFKKIITYTTRPIRDGEIEDITYHYITNDDFLQKIEEGFFAEWKNFNVNDDEWYYGTSKEDLVNSDEKSVIILTPDGIRDVKKININCVVIYLYANLFTIRKRLKIRNDSNDEMENRILRDLNDFKNAEFLSDKVVYNNDEMNISNVTENVIKQYEKVVKM